MFLKIAKQGRNEWWRWVLTLVLVIAGVVIGQLPMTALVFLLGDQRGMSTTEIAAMADSLDLSPIGLGQNVTLILLLLGFAGGMVALWLSVKFLHRRLFRSLITPLANIDWSKICFSFGLWMGLAMLVEFVIYLTSPGSYTLQFQPGPFLGLLFISLVLLPIQTSFEELFFRGYLLQGLGLASTFRLIPWVATSVLFGALHFMNPEVQAFGLGLSMTYYIGVGLFLGLVTLMDDSLEMALGIHAATNIFGALFVTFDDSAIPTAAIFHASEVNMSLMLGGFIISAAVFIFIVAKRYSWKDWTKLYGRVDEPHFTQV